MTAPHAPGVWREVGLVAGREFRERIRSRSFQVSTVITLLVVAALVVLPALVDTTPGTRRIGVTGPVPPGLPAAIDAQAAAAGIKVKVVSEADQAAGEAALRRGDLAALVLDGRQLVWHRTADQQLAAVLGSAVALMAVREQAAEFGLSAAQVDTLLAPAPLASRTLEPEDPRRAEREGAAMVALALLLMAISFHGAMVLTGVVEEKSGRVVEVLLAHLQPWQLLAGKVAGIGLLGLAQFAALGATALGLTAAFHPFDVPPVGLGTFAVLTMWFILGYAIYSVAYGALGALAPRPEEAQNATGPVTVCLLVAYFAAITLSGSPHSLAARLVSMFPLTAPLAMPERLVLGGVPWWEVCLAVASTVAAAYGLIRLGGRVYAGAVLHTGRRIRLAEAWRSTQLRSGHGHGTAPA